MKQNKGVSAYRLTQCLWFNICKCAGIGIVQDKKKGRKSIFFKPHYFYNIAVSNLEPKENKVDKQWHIHTRQMYKYCKALQRQITKSTKFYLFQIFFSLFNPDFGMYLCIVAAA